MLDERKSDIIRALIDEHIRTGEPVSSRAILEVSGLSVSTANQPGAVVVGMQDANCAQNRFPGTRLRCSRACPVASTSR